MVVALAEVVVSVIVVVGWFWLLGPDFGCGVGCDSNNYGGWVYAI